TPAVTIPCNVPAKTAPCRRSASPREPQTRRKGPTARAPPPPPRPPPAQLPPEKEGQSPPPATGRRSGHIRGAPSEITSSSEVLDRRNQERVQYKQNRPSIRRRPTGKNPGANFRLRFTYFAN